MKMFQSKEAKSLRGIRHTPKFRWRTDTSRDTQSSYALSTQLSHIITERAIHYGVVMDGWSFGQNQ